MKYHYQVVIFDLKRKKPSSIEYFIAPSASDAKGKSQEVYKANLYNRAFGKDAEVLVRKLGKAKWSELRKLNKTRLDYVGQFTKEKK